MSRQPSFTESDVAAAVLRMVQERQQPTLRAVRLALGRGSPNLLLRAYRRSLAALAVSGDPLVIAAIRRLKVPLPGGGRWQAKAAYIRRVAVKIRDAAGELERLAGRMATDAADAESYRQAGNLLARVSRLTAEPGP